MQALPSLAVRTPRFIVRICMERGKGPYEGWAIHLLEYAISWLEPNCKIARVNPRFGSSENMDWLYWSFPLFFAGDMKAMLLLLKADVAKPFFTLFC